MRVSIITGESWRIFLVKFKKKCVKYVSNLSEGSKCYRAHSATVLCTIRAPLIGERSDVALRDRECLAYNYVYCVFQKTCPLPSYSTKLSGKVQLRAARAGWAGGDARRARVQVVQLVLVTPTESSAWEGESECLLRARPHGVVGERGRGRGEESPGRGRPPGSYISKILGLPCLTVLYTNHAPFNGGRSDVALRARQR